MIMSTDWWIIEILDPGGGDTPGGRQCIMIASADLTEQFRQTSFSILNWKKKESRTRHRTVLNTMFLPVIICHKRRLCRAFSSYLYEGCQILFTAAFQVFVNRSTSDGLTSVNRNVKLWWKPHFRLRHCIFTHKTQGRATRWQHWSSNFRAIFLGYRRNST